MMDFFLRNSLGGKPDHLTQLDVPKASVFKVTAMQRNLRVAGSFP